MDGGLYNAGYLWTKETYADFILELEFKTSDGYAKSERRLFAYLGPRVLKHWHSRR